MTIQPDEDLNDTVTDAYHHLSIETLEKSGIVHPTQQQIDHMRWKLEKTVEQAEFELTHWLPLLKGGE